MPRSITTKLILAFLLVGVLVLALASGITYWLTAGEFRQFTYEQARGRFVADVTYYYETHGSWQGVLAYYEQRNTTNSRFNPPPNAPLPGPAEGGATASNPLLCPGRSGRADRHPRRSLPSWRSRASTGTNARHSNHCEQRGCRDGAGRWQPSSVGQP